MWLRSTRHVKQNLVERVTYTFAQCFIIISYLLASGILHIVRLLHFMKVNFTMCYILLFYKSTANLLIKWNTTNAFFHVHYYLTCCILQLLYFYILHFIILTYNMWHITTYLSTSMNILMSVACRRPIVNDVEVFRKIFQIKILKYN
jgi:hypothetical protein